MNALGPLGAGENTGTRLNGRGAIQSILVITFYRPSDVRGIGREVYDTSSFVTRTATNLIHQFLVICTNTQGMDGRTDGPTDRRTDGPTDE